MLPEPVDTLHGNQGTVVPRMALLTTWATALTSSPTIGVGPCLVCRTISRRRHRRVVRVLRERALHFRVPLRVGMNPRPRTRMQVAPLTDRQRPSRRRPLALLRLCATVRHDDTFSQRSEAAPEAGAKKHRGARRHSAASDQDSGVTPWSPTSCGPALPPCRSASNRFISSCLAASATKNRRLFLENFAHSSRGNSIPSGTRSSACSCGILKTLLLEVLRFRLRRSLNSSPAIPKSCPPRQSPPISAKPRTTSFDAVHVFLQSRPLNGYFKNPLRSRILFVGRIAERSCVGWPLWLP